MEIITFLVVIGLLPEPSTGTQAGAEQIAIWVFAIIFLSIFVFITADNMARGKKSKEITFLLCLAVLVTLVFMPGTQFGIVAIPIVVALAAAAAGYRNSGQ